MGQAQTNYQPLPLFMASIRSFIHLERSNGIPLYRQISQGLREAILSGELPEGTRLPPERTLARELGVNRTTVMNAYNDLSAEGLIEGHVGRGTLVKRGSLRPEEDYFDQTTPSWLLGLAANEDSLIGRDTRAVSELTSLKAGEEIISLAQGTPSADMLPADLIRSIMADSPLEAQRSALGYCPVDGLLSLRRHIAARMRTRGVRVDVQNILILSGSTQGLGLLGRFLLSPGDEVVVEVPTYLGAIQMFRALGARIIGIPTDSEGMRVDLLEAILARRQPRFIYTLPTFQNPTGVVMSVERRRRLLQLARRYQVPIVEDDAYGEIYFGEQPSQPLKSLDTYGNVLYLSTYSKMLAPGLRVAWLAAPEPVIERMGLYKQTFDLNTNALGQWIIAELIRRDLLDGHLSRARQCYQHKLNLMLEAIATYWPSGGRAYPPTGGMHLWCRLPHGMQARHLLREAAHERVAFVCGDLFHVDGGGHHYIRLSFASPEEAHITEGVRRIGVAMRRLLARRTHSEEQDLPIEHMPMV
ncbi:MocR-like pyridoxine biosynthesis transcription factor PdxR [Dictyobacter aurantiacus]|uniref:Putative HTH-type transcriptional regulator YdfD n=1 Tax=Dictyobacter aurantiacus TaxID=1936993 RepID=A0A401ZBA6_9CHLR|nr:PLP-dependent aminotransferase family protein [Dictyobacter aurantiacus]GCE04033.1 putative HTH-type transcriptional regulator YdfD [Dictyobacter aurantiacus]